MNVHEGLIRLLPNGDPILQGGACSACGYIFYPYQTLGCESCGATDCQPCPIEPTGWLVAWATVFVHPDPKRPPPFTVGEVALDAGPVVRAIIDASVDADALAPDVRVTGHLTPPAPGEDGDEASRFRFTLKGTAA